MILDILHPDTDGAFTNVFFAADADPDPDEVNINQETISPLLPMLEMLSGHMSRVHNLEISLPPHLPSPTLPTSVGFLQTIPSPK